MLVTKYSRDHCDEQAHVFERPFKWGHRLLLSVLIISSCDLLTPNRDPPTDPLSRTNPPLGDVTVKRDAFKVAQRTYKQQYASIYFLRLAVLKDYCVNACTDKWGGMTIAGQNAKHVDRVLDVRQGELGWVVGTVYMDLPLKPNVLEDLARDVRFPLSEFDWVLMFSISLRCHRQGRSILTRMEMCRSCLRMRVDG